MTLLLPARSPSLFPPISSRGAELAQMRDTLKNKLLIWDWVDSYGWPVLKGTAKNRAVGSAYYFSGYKALMFSLVWRFLNQTALTARMWAGIHRLFIYLAKIFIHWSWWLDLPLTGGEPWKQFSLPEASQNQQLLEIISRDHVATGSFCTVTTPHSSGW